MAGKMHSVVNACRHGIMTETERSLAVGELPPFIRIGVHDTAGVQGSAETEVVVAPLT